MKQIYKKKILFLVSAILCVSSALGQISNSYQNYSVQHKYPNKWYTIRNNSVMSQASKDLDTFDDETLTTINKFFENNLNVSETSRQLYIHRNTLVYRLDKLQKSTGLDLRVFEDAITFKIALMVVKYMKYMEKQDY